MTDFIEIVRDLFAAIGMTAFILMVFGYFWGYFV